MWLSEKLKEEGKKLLTKHTVTVGGEKPVVGDKGKLDSLMPYGLFSALPSGKKVFALEEKVIGNVDVPENIPKFESGEVCLYGKGGYILIKNSGEIIINGKSLVI